MSRLARFTNNATSRLAGNLSAAGLSLTVTPGDGAKFPSLAAGQYFTATLVKADGTKEIIKVTARATDTFTIVRAYEAAAGVQTAFSFSAGDKIELRMTAGALGNELDRLDLAALTRAVTKSANYTVVEGDISTLIRVDTSGGACTITLPQISSLTDAFEIVVTKITADVNLVNVTPSGGDTINGGSAYSLSSSFQSAWVIADRTTNTWTAINSGAGGSAPVIDAFVGNGTAGAFGLSGDPVTKNNTAVYVGGVYQQKSTYTLVGTALTLGGIVPVGVPIEVAWVRPVALGSTTDDLVVTAPAPGSLWTTVRGFISWMYARYAELIGQFGSSLIGFLQDGTGATARSVQDKLREYVSAKDFGAKGDSNGSSGNGTDDTAAIQAALDYVGSNGGGTVYLPRSSGAYRITSGLKIPSFVTLLGPTADRYPYNGAANATYLMPDFATANQWVIEPKTAVGGSAVAYNAAISGGLPSGPTYNCAVRDLQIRVPSAAVVPYGGIRMHGCPGSTISNVSVVGTGCGALINQCYGGSYQLHTLTKYYGVACWEDCNANDIDVYATISDPSVNAVPSGYQLPFMAALNGQLTTTYNLSTNAHFDRCWGFILGAGTGNTSSGNSVKVTVEGFSGGTFQIASIATHFDRHYVEGAASDIEFACVASLSRFNCSSFHAFDTSSGAIFDLGSNVVAEVSINGNLSAASFGVIYNSPTTSVNLKGCGAVGIGFTTPQVNVLFPDDPGAWSSPTLLNSWANAGGVDATVQYRKNGATGNIELKGTLTSGAIGGNAFVLPAGYRPAARRQFACNSNNAHGALIVLATGDVLPAAGSNVGFALDGVTFKQEI